jgi:hypothetical protein
MMKKLVLAGALAAVLAAPACAEDPYNANDPYNTNAKHLDAQSQGPKARAQGGAIDMTQSTGGISNTNDGPNGTVIRDGEVVGQDPDPTVRATIGTDFDQQGYK